MNGNPAYGYVWPFEIIHFILTGSLIYKFSLNRGVDDPALWARKVGNSWRTTDDINDTWARYNSVFISHGNGGAWCHALSLPAYWVQLL